MLATSAEAAGQHKNYLFADNLRFVSMAAILAIHSIAAFDGSLHWASHSLLLCTLQQPFKFASIAFFLVSGFLFGERIDLYAARPFFRRRLRNLFGPWLFWFLLFSGLLAAVQLQPWTHGCLCRGRAWILCQQGLYGSAFWFVPNLILALGMLLLLRRFLDDPRLGLVLLLLSLSYGLNIYTQWLPIAHTRATFGFVFYLWLGAWAARHPVPIQRCLARIPAACVLLASGLTLMLSYAEAHRLLALGAFDPLNTLRLSNQLYSLAVVLAVVKFRRPLWPRWMNVREHTFGLYLTHTPILYLLAQMLNEWRMATPQDGLPLVAQIALVFFILYALSCLVVRAILTLPNLRWTVGARQAPESFAPNQTLATFSYANEPLTAVSR